MHMVVSWDISAEGDRWSRVNEDLKKALDGFSWARPLSTFYVIRVAGEADRKKIQDRLLAKARATPEKVNYIVSPVMPSGRYDGYLPGDVWPKLNARTD